VKERHIAENAAPAALFPNFTTGSTPVTGTDFTRPDPRYDVENCLWYTGWNQGGLVSIELTNPEYNPCMRKDTKGYGSLTDNAGDKIKFDFDAKRTDSGDLLGDLQLYDHTASAKIHLKQLSFLGSIRNECGSVPARANSVQFEGNGTYNGKHATFRVCVQDNSKRRAKGRGESKGVEADRFYLTCTGGCTYSTGARVIDDAIDNGHIQVRQRELERHRHGETL
jgi:hypothetical protein